MKRAEETLPPRPWSLWQPNLDLLDTQTKLCLANAPTVSLATALFEAGQYQATANFTIPGRREPAGDLPVLAFLAGNPENSADIFCHENYRRAAPGDLLIEEKSKRAWLFRHDKLVDLELRLRSAINQRERVAAFAANLSVITPATALANPIEFESLEAYI